MKSSLLLSALLGLCVCLCVLLPVPAAQAAGNIQAGVTKAMFCAGCHGVDGNAAYPSTRLAGQSMQRLNQSLADFKAGKRFHPVMNVLTMGLTPQDLEDVAMFYAAQKPAGPEHASLYWRLGGAAGLDAVVDETMKAAKADPRLSGRLSGACTPQLKYQLCTATGGPCVYAGRDMKTAHHGMRISEAEFGALAENLVKVLDTLRVPERERNELLGLVAPLRTEIVGQ